MTVSRQPRINHPLGTDCVPLRSVDTPVAYRPLEATASDPPRSTTKMYEQTLCNCEKDLYPCSLWFLHG